MRSVCSQRPLVSLTLPFFGHLEVDGHVQDPHGGLYGGRRVIGVPTVTILS